MLEMWIRMSVKVTDVCICLQVINKVGDTPFTAQDEKIFSSYLQFCGIGLRNAHLYEKSQLEVKRNQVLLDLARMIFEEQSTIEHVVFRILTHTQSLIQCQRVQVWTCAYMYNISVIQCRSVVIEDNIVYARVCMYGKYSLTTGINCLHTRLDNLMCKYIITFIASPLACLAVTAQLYDI